LLTIRYHLAMLATALVHVSAPARAEELTRTITRVVAKIPDGLKTLKTDEMASLLVQLGREAVVSDARPASRFAEGHIPGAVSVPWPDLEKQGASLLPADKATPLIFYCGGVTCVLSPRSAALAREAGCTNVAVYPDGEPGWKRSDRLLESSPDFARTANAAKAESSRVMRGS
jgi:rhodanese-related sulfurtransferase